MAAFTFFSERFIHSLKTAFACIIAYYITRLLGQDTDPWVVITVLVVMCAQIYVGSVLQKSYMRFLGTIAGSLFAAGVLLSFGNGATIIALTLAVTGFVFSFIATGQEKLSYAGTLGAVTTTLILIGHHGPALHYAAMRCFLIGLGILVASVVSQFILPIHARAHLKRNQSLTLNQLKNFYSTCMQLESTTQFDRRFYEDDERIVKLLSKQRQLAIESTREPLGGSFNPSLFMQTLHCEKEILRIIDMLYQAGRALPTAILTTPELQIFHQQVVQAFDSLIESANKSTAHMQFRVPEAPPIDVDGSDGIMHEAASVLHFSAQRLSNLLRQLADLYQLQITQELQTCVSSELPPESSP